VSVVAQLKALKISLTCKGWYKHITLVFPFSEPALWKRDVKAMSRALPLLHFVFPSRDTVTDSCTAVS